MTTVAYIPPGLFLHDAAGRTRSLVEFAMGQRVGGRRQAAARVLHILGDCGGERSDSCGHSDGARISVSAINLY